MTDFKVGDIVRFVSQEQWLAFAAPGSVLRIEFNGGQGNSWYCSLLFGSWTHVALEAGVVCDGQAIFYTDELEALDD